MPGQQQTPARPLFDGHGHDMPGGDEFSTVFYENGHFFFTESLMKLVDGERVIAATIPHRIRGVHTDLKTPRISGDVSRE
jgi:hypothetical protein